MIEHFLTEEEFSENNKYFCDICKRQSELTTKKTKISKLPPFLLITINRFFFDPVKKERRKILDPVKTLFYFHITDIFKDLEMKKNDENGEYYLYAMVVHSGLTAQAGHYFAFAKESVGQNHWYLFNDIHTQCLGASPNFDDNLGEHETPYMFFFMNKTKQKVEFLKTKESNMQESKFVTPNK